jgi:hypothetical protein
LFEEVLKFICGHRQSPSSLRAAYLLFAAKQSPWC